MRLALCPTCGNKRCPRAHNHALACTNSNDPGQPGSSWAHVRPVGETVVCAPRLAGEQTASDRELLELAAKAAGIAVVRSRLDDPACQDFLTRGSARNPSQDLGPWNPLADDGDALRLAVKLRISVNLDYWSGSAYPAVSATLPCDTRRRLRLKGFVVQQFFVDANGLLDDADDVVKGMDEATRRAIVRAAAAIGRAMP